MRNLKEIETKLNQKFPGAGLLFWEDTARNFIYVPREKVYAAVEFMKNELEFDMLMDLFGVDYLNYPVELPDKNRFEIVTYLYSVKHNDRIFIKSYYPEDAPEADSLAALYKGAGWFEREAFDMYGISFKGHPDLRRILMYEGFVGYPLRKDYNIKKRQPIIGPLN